MTDYRTISSSQTGREKLVSSMPWREIVGEANLSLSQTGREKLVSSVRWQEIVGEANISLSQMSKGKQACTLPWREIIGAANNFMKDFLKVVEFVHYLKAEGCDMVTFMKVHDDL